MKISLLIFLLSLLGLLTGCVNDAGDTAGHWQTISSEQARDMMLESEEFVLLDVRTLWEFEMGHIEGAILIPYDQIRYMAVSELMDKRVPIFVYCQSGRRSSIAANTLAELGYFNVYDFGGIIDWIW
ncbi:MAG: rhodanese-like domain-containing protein [Defluviitaleaceae bacterium]|nr:rhodanese-like domain-containing protein [Defluviitaleaceae bacterium]